VAPGRTLGVGVEVTPGGAVPPGATELTFVGVGLTVAPLAAKGEATTAVDDPPLGRGWLALGVMPLAATGVPSRA